MNIETKPVISCLRELLDEDTSRLFSAELQLKNSISGWVSKDSSVSLKILMQEYLDVIEQHIRLLERFGESEKNLPANRVNRIMKVYIEQADEKLAACASPAVKDACLLAAIQGINHFKISVYGTAAAFAGTIGLQSAGLLFHQAELEEKEMDERLSFLAEHELNRKANVPAAIPA